MPEYLTPGVYVEEIDTGNKPIEGVSTSTVGFLGVAERGPATTTLITSFSDFTSVYGSYYASGGLQYYLAYSVEGFFQNGGQRCFVQAVMPSGATAATLALGTLNATAAGTGLWGDRVAIKIEAGSIATRVRVTVMYWSATPPATGGLVNVDPTSRLAADLRNPDRRDPQVIEVFDELDAVTLSPNYYVSQINNGSNLITVAAGGPALPATAGLTLLTGATAGAALSLQDFEGIPNPPPGGRTGLDAFTDIDEISLLCCPDVSTIAAATDLNNAIIDQCEVLKNRFAILNTAANEPRPVQQSYNSQYAALYYPWINIIDPSSGNTVLMPPCGHVAGIYARSDNNRGVQKDPANEIIRGIDSLQFKINDQQQALLNPIGVNALRYFKNTGNLVWGGRTTSSDPDWKYINVRRLFIFVEQSILQSTQWVVFEINDEPLWARVRRNVSDFLTRLWMDDMLQGATKEQAFFVRCDRTTMTQSDIDNGRLICMIGIAPVKPAEFVIFRIGQWSGGSDVTE